MALPLWLGKVATGAREVNEGVDAGARNADQGARLRKSSVAEETVKEWAIAINMDGLAACERLIANEPGPFCFGSAPTIADCFLVPQLGNARRNAADVSGFSRLVAAEAACRKLDAFAAAEPERQPDAA